MNSTEVQRCVEYSVQIGGETRRELVNMIFSASNYQVGDFGALWGSSVEAEVEEG